MTRIGLTALALASLAACSPEIPDSAAGVGFGDYQSYQAAREADLQGTAAAAPTALPADGATPVVSGPLSALNPAATVPLDTPQETDSAEATAAAAMAALGQPAQETPAQQPATTEPPQARRSSAAISDEQDFSAVTSRETIESDRQRLEAQRQQYQVIEPTALPERTENAPNIVQFALTTTNSVGESLYSRSGGAASSARACAKYASPDLAQEAFLAAGGPRRDSKNLDPDGDGFACYWDPAPFRLARQ